MNTLKKLKTTTIIFIKTFLLLAILNSCYSQKTSDKATKIDQLVSLYADYDMFHGTILVADQGKIIYKKGFGLANMEWDIKNTIHTKFQIASMTKSFTALLIMQLVAENKLDLHKPISTYLPDYPKVNGDQITIHYLLTHSAGIGHNKSNKEKHNKPKDMVNQFANEALQFKPGERFDYSNSGYTLLGYIIETITKKSYGDVLQERIFKPLKMQNSGFHKHRPLIKQIASGYYKNFGEYYDNDSSDESTAYAAGAIYSTIEDLFIWDQALNTEILLPKKYKDLMFEKHIIDANSHYGYGWELREKPVGNTSEKVETVGHSGSIGGFRTLYTKIPSRNASIIILNNTSNSFRTSITTAITGILYDKSYDLPLKPLAMFMTKEINKNGIDKGIQFYKKHKDSRDYHVSEQELIVAGYKFLHANNAKYAVEVFKLSTEVFPYKDNPYDSYAEALMTLGKNEEAIINYKKSLELNSNNNNAKEMLKKLGVDIDKINFDLLIIEENWGKEIIPFPPHYAPKLTYKGVEEAYFPKGWRKPESQEFWSFAFVWNINITEKLTTPQLEADIQTYYDGLMDLVNKNKELTPPKTVAKLDKKEITDGIIKHTGTVKIFDAFATNKPLLLNTIIEQHYCKKKKKYLLVFKFSPKPFNNNIWNTINEIKINDAICDL